MKRQPAALISHLPRQGHRQGNSNPIYHAIARSQYGPYGNKACDTFATGGPAWNCTFNDVTVGDDDMDCTGPYNCYDPAMEPGSFLCQTARGFAQIAADELCVHAEAAAMSCVVVDDQFTGTFEHLGETLR